MNFKLSFLPILYVLHAGAVKAQPAPTQYTISQIREMVQNDNIKSVDELLPRLKASFRKNFLLIYRSKSLQRSSPLFPRAIMYEPDASFIMAFNGNPEDSGYRSIEMIEFDSELKQFVFGQIKFDGAGGVDVTLNDKLCKACHRQESRPNWETYPVWDGAYGTVHQGLAKQIDEETEIANFFAGPGKVGRYQFLINKEARFKFGVTFSQPNVDFTKKVAHLNFQRIVKKVMESENYSTYKYAVLGSLVRCDIETFIPEEIRLKFTYPYSYYLEQSLTIEKELEEKQLEIADSSSVFYRPEAISSLRFIFEGRGIPMDDWALTFEKGTYSFSTGRHGILDMLPILRKSDPELGEAGDDCEVLKKRSLDRFGER
ncbi:MAG: hypothetical protein AB7T49_11315 [Oligoflexales bacterium]